MKKYFFILTIFYVAALSCNTPQGKTVQLRNTTDTTERKQKIFLDRIKDPDEFLGYFKTVKVSDLEIESNFETKGNYAGVEIDRKYFKIYSDFYLKNQDYIGDTLHSNTLFAYYKFNITSERIGLIIRREGMYVASKIDLIVFNKKDTLPESYFQLADDVGDAGWYMDQKSWLKDLDKTPVVISFTHEFIPIDMPGPKDMRGILHDTVLVYKWANNKFEKDYAETTADSAVFVLKIGRTQKISRLSKDTIFYGSRSKRKNYVNFDAYKKKVWWE